MEHPSIVLFVGHFGSGKTEMATNYALEAAGHNENVTLVDLDIVNPFFRSSDIKEILSQHKIDLLSPNFVGTTSDVPSLPATIQGAFYRNADQVIFDVGGDPMGATVLGRYHDDFTKQPYKMYFVINTCRPFTGSERDIISYIREIENHSRLKVTHLVCNTNLGSETTVEIIKEGLALVKAVSETTKIPLAGVGVPSILLPEAQGDATLQSETFFPLELFMTKWRQN